MDDDQVPLDFDGSRPGILGIIAASFVWTVGLSGGVLLLALGSILVGAALPFRYVGF